MKALYWIISAAIAVAGIGVMSVGAAQISKQNRESIEERTETFASIENLNVSLGSARVTLRADEKAEDVSVVLKNAPKTVKLEEKNGNLTLSDEERGRLSFLQFGDLWSEQRFEAIITVPADTELGAVTFSLGSGSGTITEQHIGALDISLGSGELLLEGSEISGKTAFSVGSGSVALTEDSLRTFYSESGSGSMVFTHVDIAEDLELHAASGSVKGESVSAGGRTTVEFASGSMRLSDFTPGSLTDIDLASGTIELGLTGAKEDYSFQCSNASGKTTIGEQSGKDLVVSGGAKQIISDAASGSVKFTFAQ